MKIDFTEEETRLFSEDLGEAVNRLKNMANPSDEKLLTLTIPSLKQLRMIFSSGKRVKSEVDVWLPTGPEKKGEVPKNPQPRQKGIVIETKKEVKNGVNGRRIVRVSALHLADLPVEYSSESPACYLIDIGAGKKRLVIIGFHNDLLEGNFLSEGLFQDSLRQVRLAGERLHRINKEKRSETFMI